MFSSSLFRIARRSMTTHAVSQERIGFIGLGQMGARMAPHLRKHGYILTIFDANPASGKEALEAGARSASSPAEVAAESDIVITMLPTSAVVREVYSGANGIFSAARDGQLFIDSSTIDPSTSKDLYTRAKSFDCSMIDAPVSGGVGGAAAGTLTFMVGGSQVDFNRARPVLETMGKNVVHCGGISTGQVAKICNNMVLGISMAAVSEAMNLGVELGMDPKALAGIFNTSSARCWSSDTYNPFPEVMDGVPASRNYDGGFGSSLMLKDLTLATTAAQDAGVPCVLGSLTRQLYQLHCQKGFSKKDFSSILKFYQKSD